MTDRRTVVKTLAAAAGAAVALPRLLAAEARPTMRNRPIPLTGELLPVIGIGTSDAFEVGSSANDRGPIEEVMKAFVAGGGRLLDTSPMYGTAEEVVGDTVSKLGLRESLFVATKVWTTGIDEGVKQMTNSFAKLRAQKVDLMQIHNLVDWRTQLATLRAWKEAGKIRYVGVTHYKSANHDQLLEVITAEPFDFVQLNYSIADRAAEKRLLPFAADRGIAVLVNRPFEDGALFGQVRGKPVPEWAAEIGCASWAQIFLKFVVAHPAVTCAIPATGKIAHLRDNLAAGFGELPNEAQRRKMIEAAVGA